MNQKWQPSLDQYAPEQAPDHRQSFVPGCFRGFNPYGNAAAIEAMNASLAPEVAPEDVKTPTVRDGKEANRPLKTPQMLKDEKACREANDKDDRYWLKQGKDVLTPGKQPSIPFKLIQWLLHSGPAC